MTHSIYLIVNLYMNICQSLKDIYTVPLCLFIFFDFRNDCKSNFLLIYYVRVSLLIILMFKLYTDCQSNTTFKCEAPLCSCLSFTYSITHSVAHSVTHGFLFWPKTQQYSFVQKILWYKKHLFLILADLMIQQFLNRFRLLF